VTKPAVMSAIVGSGLGRQKKGLTMPPVRVSSAWN
jgi:hypothetical protein